MWNFIFVDFVGLVAFADSSNLVTLVDRNDLVRVVGIHRLHILRSWTKKFTMGPFRTWRCTEALQCYVGPKAAP